MGRVGFRRVVIAVLTAAMVLAQIPSSLWPALLPAVEADAAPINTHAVLIGSANISQPASTLRAAQVLQSYGKLPLSFEVNRGQIDAAVDFIARGPGYTIFLTPSEQVLALRSAGSPAAARGDDLVADQAGAAIVGHGGSVVRMRLMGANVAAEVLGLDELAGKVNYFIGNDPANWRTNVSTYAKVRYGDVYAGVDLVYYGNQDQLEYDFVLAPGADPSVIAFGIDGAERLSVDGAGDLVISLAGGEVRQRQPHVYQDVEGSRREIPAGYVLGTDMVVGFHVGAYDTSRPLVIDPVLVYSTYLGGSGEEEGHGIAVDAAGNAYVTGSTGSANFPTTSPLQATFGGVVDVFVTKINAAGSARVYSTYLGGSSVDVGNAIAVDATGNAYITGSTSSTNFPTLSALQGTLGGLSDAFVTKLTAAGSALVYSTYLGGTSADDGNGIAVDGAGSAYVAGRTNSANFPTTASSLQFASGGLDDAFVAKLTAAGSALVYSTYLGGSGTDDARGIAVDTAGSAYVTGRTSSTTTFPTASPLQPAFGGGGQDAYVTKLNAAGSALVYSTFLGGGDNDTGQGIAVDAAGSAYVTGSTSSTNFPTTSPLQATLGGVADAFVTKINAAGSARVYSTYLGGSGGDNGSAIAVDAAGNAYLTGRTASTDFPTASPLQAAVGGGFDAFVTKLNAAGSVRVYSTYLGGSGNDDGHSIAVDAAGSVYVTGYTDSATTFPTASPLQAVSGGSRDAFVAKISDLADLIVTAFSGPASVTSGDTANYTWTIKNQGGVTANAVTTSPPGPPFVWGDQVWLSTSPTSIAGAFGAGGRTAQGSLAPGASYSSTFSATISSSVPPGNYYFILETDSNAQIAESDETNNLSVAVPVTITAAPFVVNTLDDVVDGSGCDATHCSLREAIIAANGTAVLDAITFSVSGTIAPTSALPAITQPLLINGTASDGSRIVIDGTNAGGAPGLRLQASASTVRNLVIQFFAAAGIEITGSNSAVEGSYIGTNAAGDRPRPNGGGGVVIRSSGNRIGGTTTAQRNVIGGNGGVGVWIVGTGADNNRIEGNFIGLGSDGAADVANSVAGVNIQSANNTVLRNVISANNVVGAFSHGVMLESPAATGNVVAGNLIGPRANGTRGFPNNGSGVYINGAKNNRIGGSTAADRNVISGNSKHGVHVTTSVATGNVIEGNVIGLEIDGSTALGNGLSGVAITALGFPSDGYTTVRGNVIASNGENGVKIERSPMAHVVDGNVIGLSASGLTARPNVGNGIYVYLGETPQPAAMQISLNTVSANGVHGIYVYGVGGATIASNRIGLAIDGTPRGNGSDGITLLNSSNLAVRDNQIVGNGTGVMLGLGNVSNTFTGNVLRGNGSTGFSLNGATNVANTIAGGSISGHPGKGISLVGGANAGILAPVVTRVSAGDGLSISGTGAVGNTVAIYADPADEGLEFLGTAVVTAGGTWQKSSGWAIPDTSAIQAALRARTRVITATQTDASGNTSEFSAGVGIPVVAAGTAQHRETPDGTTIISVTLGGAIVTLIPPTGTKRRVTADASGNFSFGSLLANTAYVVGYDGTVAGRHYIAGVRFTTDALGGASIPAPHAVFNRKNHTWVTALTIADDTPVADQVWRRGQATWYRYAISPQTSVTIDLTGCAFNCDLVIYKDLQQVKAKLEANAQTLAGLRLSAQGDIMADDLDADDLDADDLDADDLDADDLDADDLDADDLDADDLDAAALAPYSTTYVAVQRKGLRAASLTPGLAPESVTINTRDLTGYLYIRVAGGSSLTGVFSVKARRTPTASCLTAPLVTTRQPSTTAASLPAGKRSLILTDTTAYGLAGQAKIDFLTKLGLFAAHSTVDGHVLDLADDAGIQQLRADWASGRTCVAQANLLTDAIREIVQRFRSRNPGAEYLVNVGGDAVIPFRRVADWAEISRESRYSPPLDSLSASEASLVGNNFLSDDFYVSSPIESPNRTLYLPEIAVGRLVETVEDVSAYLDMYLLTNGVASPTSALSTGYDFNLDLASYVTAQLGDRGLAVDSTLVSNTWTSADWRAKVLATPAADAFGILSLQGHFSANRLVPSDNGQRIRATEIAAVTDGRFRRALVYSLGCHSGYSIVNADGSIFTQPLAFPEAFVGRGATLVGGTGYQYGETVLMKNSEALLAALTLELGYSTSPTGASYAITGVPIGKALMQAKRAYMAQTATPRGIDLKVVGVSTVYGSPTMAFKLPAQQPRPSSGIVAPVAVAGSAGLSALNVGPSFTLTPVPALNPTYYTAGGATTTAPYRPIAPLVTVPANVAGSVLQGAVFLGGAYAEAPFVPQLSIPATELAGDAPRYANDVFMPVLPVKTNLFDGDAVQIVPFQYRSNLLGTAGTARVFANVSTRAYWSSRTGTAAAADAPVIRDVAVKAVGGELVVIATLRGLTDPGIAEVYTTYTNTAAANRSFASILMTEIPGTTVSDGVGLPGFTRLYTATIPGDLSTIRFLVQAVGGNGRVAAATANGQLYGLPLVRTPAVDARTAGVLTLSAPATATYRSTITATATLTAGGQALNGKSVTFTLGGSSRTVATVNGSATATLEVNVTPRAEPYALTAAFAGDASAFGSGASAHVTVGKAPTTLQAIPASPQYSDGASVARLVLANGLTLNEQPVIITRGGVSVATFTDFGGDVRFDTIDFGAGVGASTLVIVYPGNERYAGTSATVTVPVLAENATLVLTQLGPQAIGPVTFSMSVTQAADGSLGDITRASVAFTFTPEGGTTTSQTLAVDATGAASVTVTLPAGLYQVTAVVTGDFTSDLVAMSLPVYDASLFVSGGGWLTTGAGSYGVPIGARASLGFIARYRPDGVTATGNLNLHVKSATGKDSDTDAQAQANGSLKFKAATSFDWLVIAGNDAAFAGTGTVNGTGSYRFRADAVDDTADLLVVHIWDPLLAAGSGGSYEHPKYIVRGTLGGGSIRINR